MQFSDDQVVSRTTPVCAFPATRSFLAATVFLVSFVVSGSQPSHAIPAFARKYGLPCSACHIGWPILNVFGYVWSALMFFTATLNLILVFTVDVTTWAKFNLFFPPISIIGLFVIQNVFMRTRASGRRRPSDGAAASAGPELPECAAQW